MLPRFRVHPRCSFTFNVSLRWASSEIVGHDDRQFEFQIEFQGDSVSDCPATWFCFSILFLCADRRHASESRSRHDQARFSEKLCNYFLSPLDGMRSRLAIVVALIVHSFPHSTRHAERPLIAADQKRTQRFWMLMSNRERPTEEPVCCVYRRVVKAPWSVMF